MLEKPNSSTSTILLSTSTISLSERQNERRLVFQPIIFDLVQGLLAADPAVLELYVRYFDLNSLCHIKS
jgi:hypothetical protein